MIINLVFDWTFFSVYQKWNRMDWLLWHYLVETMWQIKTKMLTNFFHVVNVSIVFQFILHWIKSHCINDENIIVDKRTVLLDFSKQSFRFSNFINFLLHTENEKKVIKLSLHCMLIDFFFENYKTNRVHSFNDLCLFVDTEVIEKHLRMKKPCLLIFRLVDLAPSSISYYWW